MSDQSRYNRRKSAQDAGIGTIPAVRDPARKASNRLDLHGFLRTYQPNTTGLSPFGKDQIRMISRIETCILEGGRFVNCIYRGGCKTSISEGAAIWGGLYGHRKFFVVFGADDRSAGDIVDSIRGELETNDLLMDDFPEACHAIRHLENRSQRCHTQSHVPGDVEGFTPDEDTEPLRTHIEWAGGKVTFPRIVLPDGLAACSGIAIACRGLTGSFLGMAHKRFDGVKQRPDCLLLDDIQTPETASTLLQVNKRCKIISDGVLKLGGHGRRLAVVMNATPLAHDDVVERLCDPIRNPSWQSERSPMIHSMPAALQTLWLGEYARLRNSYDRNVVGDQERAHRAATEFYRARKADMDAGAECSWEHCFIPDIEISALQHAMNILIDDGWDSFNSQAQCQPIKPHLGEPEEMDAHDIANKLSGLPAGVVPLKCSHAVCFIDVQKTLLYWMVAAFADDFTGSILSYGSFPDQASRMFALRDAQHTLKTTYPHAGVEGGIHAGLKALTDQLLDRPWKREDGTVLKIERCLIDSGFLPDVVHGVVSSSRHGAVLMASKGFSIGAKGRPFGEYTPKTGERFGESWIISPATNGRRLLKLETNHWKSSLYARLATATGDKGALTLYGHDSHEHAMVAAHIHSEFRTRTSGHGRDVDEWEKRPGAGDNHLLDCAVGVMVAASTMGCSVLEVRPEKTRKPRIPLSQMGKPQISV